MSHLYKEWHDIVREYIKQQRTPVEYKQQEKKDGK